MRKITGNCVECGAPRPPGWDECCPACAWKLRGPKRETPLDIYDAVMQKRRGP